MSLSFLSTWGRHYSFFLQGFWVTLEITAGAFIIAVILGFILALARLSNIRTLKGVATAYVDLIRAVPVLVLLFITYYSIPQFGIQLSGFMSGVVTLGAFYGAIYCEVFRGGIQGVDPGQREAAMAVGMNSRTTMRKVVLPQAFMAILPPATNQLANMIKDTSLVMTIGVSDLMLHAYEVGSNDFQWMAVFTLAGVFYFALYLILSRVIVRWENSVRRRSS